MLQAGRDCHRRGPMHPEHEWWAWALTLPKQFVPSGYRSTLAYVWRRWLAFRLNRTCPGCGKEARRTRRRGQRGQGGGPSGFELDHRDGDASNGHASNFQWLCARRQR